MPSNRQLAFFHGKMLVQIAELIGVEPNRDNKDVIKAMIKRLLNIDSLSALDNIGMSRVITQTAIFFATEFGFSLDLPGEDNVDEQEMKELLKMVYHNN